MKDKLLIEIDMHNGELNDAIPALIFLTNELVESPTIEIFEPAAWKERSHNNYQVKWRFSEDELHIPFEVDFVEQLTDELRSLKQDTSNNSLSAIKTLQTHLESLIAKNRFNLFAEAD
jgi:hypothetical protein